MSEKTLYPRIIAYPPGPKTRELLKRDYKVASPSLERGFPLSIEYAEGPYLTDLDGNRYIDLTSGWLTSNLGHRHPAIARSIEEQMKKLISFPYRRFYNQLTTELSEELARIAPGASEKKVLLSTSREDSIDAALKMARWNTRRQIYLTHIGSYHGGSIAATSLTSDNIRRRLHMPSTLTVFNIPFPYCYRCPLTCREEPCISLYCLQILEEILATVAPPQDTAAFLLEPIQVYNGIIIPPDEYMEKLWKTLRNNGIPLIVNEGYTALGRTGSWFAVNHWNIIPEAVTVSENLASGLPIAALIADIDLMDWYPGSHSTTMAGNPIAASAALATIATIRSENLMPNANREGLYIKKRLKEAQEQLPNIGDVRGIGLLTGIEIIKTTKGREPDMEKAERIVRECWRKGIILDTCGKSTILIAPPINIPRETIDLSLEIIEASIRKTMKN
ncbi:MAG: aminotransferase class III-fold pyridoxal phosphate-dependent enzyme [Candidatus Bathyarchaeia archaeon]